MPPPPKKKTLFHSRGGVEHDSGAGAVGLQDSLIVAADPRRDGPEHVVHGESHLAQLHRPGPVFELRRRREDHAV